MVPAELGPTSSFRHLSGTSPALAVGWSCAVVAVLWRCGQAFLTAARSRAQTQQSSSAGLRCAKGGQQKRRLVHQSQEFAPFRWWI